MELENRTPVSASLVAAEVHEALPRIGLLVAKATFRFLPDGSVGLDRDDPYPVFEADEETPLGLLPRDTIPRTDTAFEVVLLGSAHAQGGIPVERMYVTLGVGDHVRHLLVVGDRWWHIQLDNDGWPAPEACEPSNPTPFTHMPLTWDRSFGGSAVFLIAPDSPLTVSHPLNPPGRGFDPGPSVRSLVHDIGAPPGFPTMEWIRPLPNLEDPEDPITRWDSDPTPVGWATLPLASGIRAMSVPLPEFGKDAPILPSLTRPPELPPEILHRAHPDWVLPTAPPPGSWIFLRGLVQDRWELHLPLPPLRVLGDYRVGSREGTLELRPDLLAILPDEGRFYLVYRTTFRFDFDPRSERCFRLRLERGWYQPPEAGTP